jgi:glycosyltransferase involved in cell wall biosynthesis
MRVAVATRCRNEAAVLPWFLANCTFSDEVHVADGGSDDGTWDLLQAAADRDPRVRPRLWDATAKPYARQDEHYRFLLEPLTQAPPDWLFLADADEVYTTEFQANVRGWLECQPPCADHVGVEARFLYLCPGWAEYYTVLSRWPYATGRSRVPAARLENTETGFALESPTAFRQLPDEWAMVHFNYPMTARFERKRTLYAAKFGYDAWHPDERYPERTAVPGYCRWYDPSGKVVGPGDMPEYGLEVRE